MASFYFDDQEVYMVASLLNAAGEPLAAVRALESHEGFKHFVESMKNKGSAEPDPIPIWDGRSEISDTEARRN